MERKSISAEKIICSLFDNGFDRVDDILYVLVEGKISEEGKYRIEDKAFSTLFCRYVDYDGYRYKIRDGKNLDSNALNDPNYASCKSDLILFGNEPESLKDYYEKKKLLNEDALAILSALEPLYIKNKVEIEEEVEDNPDGFKPDPFMISISKRDPGKTIVPSTFIKYIVTKENVMMNSSYLELLNKELQGKIIEFIENRCKRNLEM